MDILGGICGTLFASLLGGGDSPVSPAYEPGGGIGFFWRPEMDQPRPVALSEDEEEILLALALLDL